MRPDDDIKLGKLMKAGGFSELVLGEGAINTHSGPNLPITAAGPSRGGDLFPHLYAALPVSAVRRVRSLPLAGGAHVFPEDLP